MLCGSCLRDNRLAATLRAAGRRVTLVPLYTPLRTDEDSVAEPHVLYGGINVYLQQALPLLRLGPREADGALISPRLLARLSGASGSVRPSRLGAMTVSVLLGEEGRQRKELERLLDWVVPRRFDVICLPNLMLLGLARKLRAETGTRIACTLSGEDVFVHTLPEPHRSRAMRAIRERSRDVDAFIAVTRYFAEHASRHFGLPRERVHVVPLGVNTDDFEPAQPAGRFTIGYLARICPEKGLLSLARAFATLRQQGRDCRLVVGGYLSAADRPYFERIRAGLRARGLEHDCAWLGELDRAGKLAMLRSLHALSVPTAYAEAKGLYVLEAFASGVPVVQPAHGSFPELIEETGGGLLVPPGDSDALAAALARLMDDEPLRRDLAQRGAAGVRAGLTDRMMAERTWALFEQLARGAPLPSGAA